MIRIFDRVLKQVPARLLMIGEGPEWSRAVQLVQELNIESHVEFLGKKDEVAHWISLADLLLLPSEKESFGLVALEAMACGVPTVGSKTGGLPEVVIHGETGYLAEVGDVEAMARYAVRLLTDPDLHRSVFGKRHRPRPGVFLRGIGSRSSMRPSIAACSGRGEADGSLPGRPFDRQRAPGSRISGLSGGRMRSRPAAGKGAGRTMMSAPTPARTRLKPCFPGRLPRASATGP